MVLIFNSTVSREISRTNFIPTRAITYTYTTPAHIFTPLIVSRSLRSLANDLT